MGIPTCRANLQWHTFKTLSIAICNGTPSLYLDIDNVHINVGDTKQTESMPHNAMTVLMLQGRDCVTV